MSDLDLNALRAVVWLPPWAPCAPGLEGELAREVGPRHPLAELAAVAVARRSDTDDVLFFLPNAPSPLAVVHLTWSSTREPSPWPATTFYTSLEDWIEHRMQPDYADPDLNR
jgi:hypothetical protein